MRRKHYQARNRSTPASRMWHDRGMAMVTWEFDSGTELIAFVCYDKRLSDSAQALGLPVEAPA